MKRLGVIGMIVGAAVCVATLLGSACSPDSTVCGAGLFCPPDTQCVKTVNCCASNALIAAAGGDGGVGILPSADGGVVLDAHDPTTGAALPPMCGLLVGIPAIPFDAGTAISDLVVGAGDSGTP